MALTIPPIRRLWDDRLRLIEERDRLVGQVHDLTKPDPEPATAPPVAEKRSKPVASLAEFDQMLVEVARMENEQDRISVLCNVHLADPTIVSMPNDPFSPAYHAAVLDLYYKLSGRNEYRPADCEKIPINIAETIIRPSVYTGGGTWLGGFLAAYGNIIKQLNVREGMRVLEYGPGDGQISLHLARLGCDVTVIDIEESYLAIIKGQAERLGLSITTIHGDFLTGADLEPFDRIFFFEAFHHSLVHQEALRQMRGMVKDEGFVVFAAEPIIDPNGYWRDAVPYPWGPRLDGLSLRAFRTHGWMELGFQEPYFLEAVRRAGWTPGRDNSPNNDLGSCYFAK